MSQVFVCSCGRRTTEPFVIGGKRMCVICAEWEDPEVVTLRERRNWRKYQEDTLRPHRDRERYGLR